MGEFEITEEMATRGGVCPVCGKFFRPNGVGPSGHFLSRVIKSLSSTSVLNYGANFHDWAYHMGGYWGSRKEADKLMYLKNKKLIKSRYKWYNAWFYHVANERNYRMVREFGSPFWGKDDCKPKVRI